MPCIMHGPEIKGDGNGANDVDDVSPSLEFPFLSALAASKNWENSEFGFSFTNFQPQYILWKRWASLFRFFFRAHYFATMALGRNCV